MAGSGGGPTTLRPGLAAQAPLRTGGVGRTRGHSPANPGHGATGTAKTIGIVGSGKQQRPRVPEELQIRPVFPRESPSCGFASISSPVLVPPQAPLLLGGFFLPPHQGYKLESPFFSSSTRGANPFPHHTVLSLSPITLLPPHTRAAAGTEALRCIKRAKLDLVL